MPIHQTKLIIANPHATGMSIPQIPTPRRISHTIAPVSIITSENVMKNPSSQPAVTGHVRTMSPMWSDTDAYVWPAARMTGRLEAGAVTDVGAAGLTCHPRPPQARDWVGGRQTTTSSPAATAIWPLGL